MTKNDIISNLGTNTKSGIKQFIDAIKEEIKVTREVEEETGQQQDQQDTNDDDEVKKRFRYKQFQTINHTKKKVTQTIKKKVSNNQRKGLQMEQISDDDYKKFYKVLAKNSGENPFNWVHFKAKGEVEFTSPSDMFDNYYGQQTTNLKLYVRRVLINKEFEDIFPRYLSFVRGVIDSDKLPLNVNRQTLQQLKMLKVISRKIAKKILELFQDSASYDDEDEQDTQEGEEDENMAETIQMNNKD